MVIWEEDTADVVVVGNQNPNVVIKEKLAEEVETGDKMVEVPVNLDKVEDREQQ
jgi:hypothetical protein